MLMYPLVQRMMMMEINVNFEIAPYYKDFANDLYNAKYLHYSLYGGRDSGKSSFMHRMVLLTVMTQGSVYVIRRYFSTLEGTFYSGICKVINDNNLDGLFKCTTKPLRITYLPSGNIINFGGIDSEKKLRSSTTSIGKYVLLVFEECDEIETKKKIEEVNSSFFRGEDSDNVRSVYIFNPPGNVNHWTNTELRKDIPGYQKSLMVNYCNIPKKWVGKPQLIEIERLKVKDPRLYRHRYLGEPLSDEDIIFENVKTQDISDEQIAEWFEQDEYILCGLDFGYSPDVNAGVMMKYDPEIRYLYIFREFYKGKLNNRQISDGLEASGFSKDYLIIGDKDEKTIADLRSFGWRIQSAVKGPGSKEQGYKWMQGLNGIVIDKNRCPNISREFLELHYCFDKYGNIRSGYHDSQNQDNHGVDATNYATEPIRRRAGA